MTTDLKHAPVNSSVQDFDFMFGSWTVRHRRLKARLSNCTEWETFDGTSATSPILGGHGNLEDNEVDFPGGSYRAVALRSFDTDAGQWAIWWLDQRAPHNLDVPVVGQFVDNIGTFFADDSIEETPIKVRFLWKRGVTPKWEQAFSVDDGKSWETNWIMEFTRVSP